MDLFRANPSSTPRLSQRLEPSHFVLDLCVAPLRYLAGADSQQGLRPNNEDQFLIDPTVSFFAVADGMGGHESGEKASLLAIQTLHQTVLKVVPGPPSGQGILAQGLVDTNRAILGEGGGGYHKMGTTIVLLARIDNKWWIANLGDSEAWLFRKRKVQVLSQTHSMAAEMVRQKAMTAKEAAVSPLKHRLVRYLGSPDLTSPQQLYSDVREFKPVAGDVILLGSDGLMEYIRPNQVVDRLSIGVDSQTIARDLTQLAIKQGSPDNTTGLVIRIF